MDPHTVAASSLDLLHIAKALNARARIFSRAYKETFRDSLLVQQELALLSIALENLYEEVRDDFARTIPAKVLEQTNGTISKCQVIANQISDILSSYEKGGWKQKKGWAGHGRAEFNRLQRTLGDHREVIDVALQTIALSRSSLADREMNGILSDTGLSRTLVGDLRELLRIQDELQSTLLKADGDFMLGRFINDLSEYAQSAVDPDEHLAWTIAEMEGEPDPAESNNTDHAMERQSLPMKDVEPEGRTTAFKGVPTPGSLLGERVELASIDLHLRLENAYDASILGGPSLDSPTTLSATGEHFTVPDFIGEQSDQVTDQTIPENGLAPLIDREAIAAAKTVRMGLPRAQQLQIDRALRWSGRLMTEESLMDLLRQGADPNVNYDGPNAADDSLSTSPLGLAVTQNNKACLEALLRYGANPRIGLDGVQLLLVAVQNGNTETVLTLAHNGLPIPTGADFGRILKAALSRGDHKMVDLLLGRNTGRVPDLIDDTLTFNIPMMEVLLRHGVGATQSMLERAVKAGSSDLTSRLLSCGVRPSWQILLSAVLGVMREAHAETAKNLLSTGKLLLEHCLNDPNGLKDADWGLLLHHAISESGTSLETRLELLELILLQEQIDPSLPQTCSSDDNDISSGGMGGIFPGQPLHCAMKHLVPEHAEPVVLLLLQYGANPHGLPEIQCPLRRALKTLTSLNRSTLAQSLFEVGARLPTSDYAGELQNAVDTENVELLKLLLRYPSEIDDSALRDLKVGLITAAVKASKTSILAYLVTIQPIEDPEILPLTLTKDEQGVAEILLDAGAPFPSDIVQRAVRHDAWSVLKLVLKSSPKASELCIYAAADKLQWDIVAALMQANPTVSARLILAELPPEPDAAMAILRYGACIQGSSLHLRELIRRLVAEGSWLTLELVFERAEVDDFSRDVLAWIALEAEAKNPKESATLYMVGHRWMTGAVMAHSARRGLWSTVRELSKCGVATDGMDRSSGFFSPERYSKTHFNKLTHFELTRFGKEADMAGGTMLHYAIQQRRLDEVVWLIEKGADVNCVYTLNLRCLRNYDRQSSILHTAIHFYASARDIIESQLSLDIIKTLRASGSRLDATVMRTTRLKAQASSELVTVAGLAAQCQFYRSVESPELRRSLFEALGLAGPTSLG